MSIRAITLAAVVLVTGCAGRAAESTWVHSGPDGHLAYKTTEHGDRVMDFSHAGYMGGGVALPDVPVRMTVQPSGTDNDAPAIQAAIDKVSALPLENGFRGAVLLGPGTFTCPETLHITTPGVVLRGSGSGPGGTTIRMTGPKHAAVVIGAEKSRANTSQRSTATTITDAYVPSGTNTFSVADPSGLSVGELIAIRRPTTPAWIHFMGMDTLRRDGKSQTWIGTNRVAVSERRVTAMDGNRVTIDVPLADSYDAEYLNPPGTTVVKVTPAPRVTQAGVERLHIQCPPLEIDYGHAPYAAVRVGGDDCWVRDLRCEETMNTTVLAGRRITVERVAVTHTYTNLGASKPTDFSIEGSQILIDRCQVTGGNTYFVWTGSVQPGPNVVLNSTFRGHGSRIQPHQRWSTGLLVDNCTVPDGGIDFMNRGVAGSGHGWTMGWGVAWNCVAKTYVIQNPPGAVNWAIGCIGQRDQTARLFDTAPILSEGVFESHGTPVAPQSLYLAQLSERLGPQAIRNIGYGSNSLSEFPDKDTPPLLSLATEDDPELGPDLALHRPVNGTTGRGAGREFSGEKAVDADPATFWAPLETARQPVLEIDTEGPVDVSALVIEESPDAVGNIRAYKVEAQVDSDWTLLARGGAINGRHIDRFPKVTAWKVRLTVLDSDGTVELRKFGLYDAPTAKP